MSFSRQDYPIFHSRLSVCAKFLKYSMHPILTQFLAWLIENHISKEKELAFDNGFMKGVESHQNTISKLNADLEESRRRENVWEIRDQRKGGKIAYDSALYGPERLPVTPDKVSKMRGEVALAVADGLVAPPTEDQWKMILSNHPATCVIAGAGSGKSTTLVLRVVFMICHLGIRPGDMTVVSFTRASCAELRKKMHQALSIGYWKDQMHPEDATSIDEVSKSLVSTFHSALSRLARKQFQGVRWFDVMSDTVDNTPEDDFDNPFASSSKLSELQMEFLLKAYRTCFAKDQIFRTHIVEMIKLECDRDILTEESEKEHKRFTLEKASDRDLNLVTMVNDKWKNTGWIMPGIDPTPFIAFSADGLPFYANGRIVETGMPVFLSLNGFINNKALFTTTEKVGEVDDAFPIINALRVRRDIVARFFGGSKLDLRTTQSIERLRYRVKYIAKTDFDYHEAPRFDIQLSGELGKCDVVEAFYAQASFIESLGIEVPETLARLEPFKKHSIEYHFTSALVRFWPLFEETLRKQVEPIMTFNRAFLLLGEAYADRKLNVSSLALRSFTHLLVDEFQDISPQIVSWLRATQHRLSIMGKHPTLMAIGDDWQSIYGWRGSAPEQLIDFGNHFPTSAVLNGHAECRMMENYRSVGPIITDAEKLLKSVKVKINKEAKAKRPSEELDHGVRMVTDVNPNTNPQAIIKEIKNQLAFVNSLPKSDKNKVVVLSRKNEVLNSIKKHLGAMQGVSFYTFHGAKGLQGEVAILCDDCDYDQNHTFRNAVYKSSGIFTQTYDEAAKDEALRLAYVAVTRGIRRVIWFTENPRGAAKLLAST
jgi:superfamily I DNA/RNA helicase